jgi:hypothetical protein
MARCYSCGDTDVYYSENNKDILINKHTGEGHRCNPAKKRVPDGIWRGWTFEKMAEMVAHRNNWTKKELDEIRRQSSNAEPDNTG